MIDAIFIPPWTHRLTGSLVLLSTLVASGWLAWLAIRRRPEGRGTHALLLAAQATLMAQALIGIKLLDQGLGQLQLYIHYVGGLAPLLFLILTYWFPASEPTRQTRNRAIAAAFLFALLAFGIGEAYVNRLPA